ncbi:MAG: GntR family transcriptional regulator [Chitinivibrionales bacterium]|nr:GntR family transcriptional regulator [Chitinivibrionales bacterium]
MSTSSRSAKTPARVRAREYLKRHIEETRRAGNSRLPPIAKLAALASVSPVTMQRAVHALRDEGILAVSHGLGVRIASSTPAREAQPPRAPGPRWREVMEAIEREILEGRYAADGRLPTPKELRHRFGVCHRTLQRALGGLVSAGVLSRYRRGYRLVRTAPRGAVNTILMVRPDSPDGFRVFRDLRTIELFSALEQQCARRDTRLDVVSDEGLEQFLAGTRRGRHPLGCVIWGLGWEPQHVSRLLMLLPSVPVAVLLRRSNEEYRALVSRYRHARIFSFSESRLPGRVMGAYLRRRGHRTVAYLSPLFHSNWTRNRLAGLRDTFEDSDRRVYAVTRHGDPRDASGAKAQQACEEALGALRAASGRTGPGGIPEALVAAVEQLQPLVSREFGRLHLQSSLEALFEEALALTEATAWVAHNDMVGIQALQFLTGRGVAVPGRMSVVGFDNSFAAGQVGLTSYDFDFPALAHLMVDYVLSGPLWRRGKHNVELEVTGSVVERASSTMSDVGTGGRS